MSKPIIVIGAGIGGLTAAALLLKAGRRVTVLEAHVYPGGCAGTFYHQGFRFDAGATLVGGFAAGGPHARLAEMLGLTWPVQAVDPAWVVHLPDRVVTQWADAAAWQAERERAFPGSESFWRAQEQLANVAWDISTRHCPWPPASARDLFALAQAFRPTLLGALPHLFHSVADIAPLRDPMLKTFVDAQLLISAQAIAEDTHALYGSAALDLPRRGVCHARGGTGALAETLVNWIRAHGGEVLYRQKVEQIETRMGQASAVRTNKGLRLECEGLLANVTPWALCGLLGEAAPSALRAEAETRQVTWGAFMVYLGLESSALPPDQPGHHQIILDPTRPLGEGNSVFISLSDSADATRAPHGLRAATLSTHTAIAPWWELSPTAYEARRDAYTERILVAAERVWPTLRRAIRLCLPGTPRTFEFYTRRPRGMVGGFPQSSLFTARGPQTGLPNVWLVGDSIFPGQSTASVTLGALRVAVNVLEAQTAQRYWRGLTYQRKFDMV